MICQNQKGPLRVRGGGLREALMDNFFSSPSRVDWCMSEIPLELKVAILVTPCHKVIVLSYAFAKLNMILPRWSTNRTKVPFFCRSTEAGCSVQFSGWLGLPEIGRASNFCQFCQFHACAALFWKPTPRTTASLPCC